MSLEIVIEEEVSNDSKEDKFICRFCLDNDFQEDLFVPCNCSGTARYVHRRCLQEWRSQDIYSLNYTRCQECLFEYEITYNISNMLSCWIRICKFLSKHYFFIFSLILGEFYLIYFLLNRFDKNNFLFFILNNNYIKKNQLKLISFVITIIPLFIFILIHDIYIFFKYRLHTYFNNYADIGIKNVFLSLFVILFFVSFISPIFSIIMISMIFQKLFKHMLEKHYYRYITEFSEIIDRIDDEELQIVIR